MQLPTRAGEAAAHRGARGGDNAFRAVESAGDHPGTDATALSQAIAELLRQGAPVREAVARKAHAARYHAQVVAHVDDAANRAVEAQRPQVVDEGRDVLVPLQRADEEAVGLGLRHEPDADSGHDAEAGLHEESVQRRADARSEKHTSELQSLMRHPYA